MTAPKLEPNPKTPEQIRKNWQMLAKQLAEIQATLVLLAARITALEP
jgi:hypothetical protein